MKRSVRQSRPATKLHDHIRELQTRLLVVVAVLVVAGIIVYFFYTPILTLLSSPLKAPLYYNSPAGGFTFVMKICFMGAIIFTIPVIIYNLIMFIRPAFTQVLPMKKIFIISGSSTVLALAGAAFAFYCIVPESLTFFKGYEVSGLNALISADSYLNFVTGIITMFVLIFQIPLVMLFIDRIKPFNINKLLNMEKWVILGSLVVTLLQPFTYDLLTSLFIAFSIIAIYNLSVVTLVLHHKNATRRAHMAVRSTIVKPVVSSELVLNDQIVESFADELVNLEKSEPISSIAPNFSYMDIKPLNTQPEIVEPAAWVYERKLRRIALSAHVHVFSDINRTPRASRALASQ